MYKDKAILALILDSLNLCFGLPINPFMYKKAKKYVSKILKKYRFYVIKMPFIEYAGKIVVFKFVQGIKYVGPVFGAHFAAFFSLAFL